MTKLTIRRRIDMAKNGNDIFGVGYYDLLNKCHSKHHRKVIYISVIYRSRKIRKKYKMIERNWKAGNEKLPF